jgi:hypothetical protein
VRGNSGPNLLYRNDGGNRFTDVAAAAGVARANPGGGGGYLQSGPVFVDLDGDADLDLFIGGLEGDPTAVFANNGNGTFGDVTAQSGFASMTAKNTISASFADYDLDGDLDLALAHWGTPRPPDGSGGNGDTETLWRNDTSASGIRFTNVSVESGVAAAVIPRRRGYSEFQPSSLDYDYSFVPMFARMDADRHPDLLVVSDFSNTRYLLSRGAQTTPVTFRDATPDNPAVSIDRLYGMGSAIGDIDSDGDLDVVLTQINGPPLLLRNDQKLGHHWLRLKLVGTRCNRDAIGAWVKVRLDQQTLYRQVMPTRSYLSQSELPVTIGLGNAPRPDAVSVIWPGGAEEKVNAVRVDGLTTVVQAR